MTQPPANVVPVCYRHPNRETYVRCTRCDRPICPDCMNEASVGFQCPECVRQGARTQRPVRTTFGGGQSGAQGTVTIALIVLNVLVFVAAFISSGKSNAIAGGGLGGLLGGSTPLHEWGALVTYPLGTYTDGPLEGTRVLLPGGMHDGEYYRIFTSMFLHYGLLHLAMNMWALWVLGRPLEAMLGRARFFALYLVSGLGGSIGVYLFAAPTTQTAGASGAIFGLFAALIVVLRRMRRSVAGIVPILILNLVITFSVPGISIAGHLGGMVTGALIAAGLAYAPQRRRALIQTTTVLGVLVVLAVLFAVHTANLTPPAGIPFVQ
ncbi:rhomboid family intramembrane serine protease [Dactylosporangium sucinum]|uniref:Rhomboid family intramembrane serine protease n=1 Tax=Dactylosporangium sucinum TaxID=1424081 RepID=A0A917T529_9ACTN|nr:rhomboid family intramembrane serine protease [Dactylosporangium sucinum]GGM10794.1 rhomboid family intramembrane serine protease [Dactylosporangium sucinum]